jgi:hypothetical protein
VRPDAVRSRAIANFTQRNKDTRRVTRRRARTGEHSRKAPTAVAPALSAREPAAGTLCDC